MAKVKGKAKPAKKAKPVKKAKPAKKAAKPAKKAAKPAKKAAKPPKKAAKPAKKAAKPPKKAAKPTASSKPAKASASIDANITLYEPVQPITRGDRYEDPVFDALTKAGLGEAGDGGGTLCSTEGEVLEVDFDVALHSLDAIPLVVEVLETQGAPKGSVLRYEDRGKTVEVQFGVAEGIAIYLDGVTQPAEVYQTTSAQELLDKLEAALGDSIEFRDSWQGPRETALYFYGLDAEAMFTKMEPVLRDYPLSRNARVIVRHGNKNLEPREVKLS